MKMNFYGLMLLGVTWPLCAQNLGDISFIGYNSDGDKDFAIVVLENIPANSTYYFTDGEPNAAGNGLVSNTEGVIDWQTGNQIIMAGTVVTFTDTETTLTASVGTAVDSSIDAGFNLSANGDNIFITIGNPANNTVTKWLAGIEFRNTGQSANFLLTGLQVGDTYVVIDDSASKDGGQYSGIRTGASKTSFRTNIANENNWTTNTADGEVILPFNTTTFQLSLLSNSLHKIEGIDVVYREGGFRVNKGQVLQIYNLTGKSVNNSNINRGVYLVMVSYLDRLGVYKILVP